MKISFRFIGSCVLGSALGWCLGRGLPSKPTLPEKPSHAAMSQAREKKPPPHLPAASLTSLAALEMATAPLSEAAQVQALALLEKLSPPELAARFRDWRHFGTAAKSDLARIAILLLVERDIGLAVDTACDVFPPSYRNPELTRARGVFDDICKNIPTTNGAIDENQLRQWLGKQNNILTQKLLSRLTRLNPDRAVALWREACPIDTSQPLFSFVCDTFAMDLAKVGRLKEALEVMAPLPNELQKYTFGALCTVVAKEQIPLLLDQLKAAGNPGIHYASLAPRYYEAAPEEAQKWLATLTDPADIRNAWQGLAQKNEGHPEVLRQWLKAAQGPARDAIFESYLRSLPARDAAEFVAQQTELPAKISTLPKIAKELRELDPAYADEWLAALPDGPAKQSLQRGLNMTAKVTDPAAYLAKLLATPASETRSSEMLETYHAFAESRSVEWLAWAAQQPPAEHAALLQTTWGRVLANAPADAARHAAALLPSQPGFAPQYAEAISAWAELNAEGAKAWLQAAPEGPAKAQGLAVLANGKK